MMTALLLPISLGLVARAPGRCPAARMGSRLDGMVLGEVVPPEVLQQLGVDGKRAVVAFFCRDNGHECGQELRDFESKATRYRAEFNCDIVAIRSRGSWVDEETPAKFPSLRFFVDEDEELKQAFRMDIGQINDRGTYLLDAGGRVPPQVESAVLAVPAADLIGASLLVLTLTLTQGWCCGLLQTLTPTRTPADPNPNPGARAGQRLLGPIRARRHGHAHPSGTHPT